ncbi:MAG: ATP-dependent DNA helicase [Nitrososphaerota archaeon]
MSSIKEIVKEAQQFFAYDTCRKYQANVINAIYNALLNKHHVLLEAPTGWGKTSVALAASLAIQKERDLKIIYLCRTNQQIFTVLNELSKIKEKGININMLGLYGRNQLCIFKPIASIKNIAFYHACSAIKAAGKCPFYSLENEKFIKAYKIIPWNCKTIEDYKKMFLSISFCPYEGIISYLKDAEVIVTTYNHIFNNFMRFLLLKRMNTSLNKVLMIIDEAHNIPKFSQTISNIPLKLLIKAIKEAEKYGFNNIAEKIKEIYEQLSTIQLEEGEAIINAEIFTELKIIDFYNIGRYIQEQKIVNNKVPTSNLLILADFLSIIKEEDISLFLTLFDDKKFIEIVRFDPLRITKPIFDNIYSSILMSGTLSPVKAYIKMIGISNPLVLKIPYPFSKENIKVLLINGISTKLKERNEILYYKIYKLLNTIKWINVNELNIEYSFGVAAFFASHELLQNFLNFLNNYNFKLNWDDIFIEKQFMNANEINRLFTNFINIASKKHALLLAIQGGRLAEGVDFIANTLKVIIIIGIPYAKPTPKIKAMITAYSKIFGKGKLYAYVIPALWSSLQAAGRGIRGPNDICMIIFMDQRFKKLKKLIPLWMRSQMENYHIDNIEEVL